MNKIDYALGVLDRLTVGHLNGKPYVMLEDVEWVIRNGGVFDDEKESGIVFDEEKENDIKNIIDVRPATSPEYYDKCGARDYQEYFIKGTNMKLGFKYTNKLNQKEYCCITTESYDDQEWFGSEENLFKHFEWLLTNTEITWRYYE